MPPAPGSSLYIMSAIPAKRLERAYIYIGIVDGFKFEPFPYLVCFKIDFGATVCGALID